MQQKRWWKPTEEDAVLVQETRTDGYVPTSRPVWHLPGDWKPGKRAKEDHALACALAFYEAEWEPTHMFDLMVVSGFESHELNDDLLCDMLNARAG